MFEDKVVDTTEETKTEKTEVKPTPKAAKGVDSAKFKERKLKAINLMSNQAKARALADRVLRNK